MASRIATQLDAYNIGGTKPTGYVASKCCTNAMAISCGCANPGYTSKRLVPEKLLKPNVTYYTLTVSVYSDNWTFYEATVQVPGFLSNEIRIGYVPNDTLTLDHQVEIEEGSKVTISFLNAWYGNEEFAMMPNGNMTLDGDLYPNDGLINNDSIVSIDFTMTSSRHIIAYVNVNN